MADTLKFMSGAEFTPTGQAVNTQAQTELANLGVQGNQYTNYVATPAPKATIDTNITSNLSDLSTPAPSSIDIQKLITDNTKAQEKIFSQIQGYFNPTPEETLAQQKYTDLSNQFNQKQTDIEKKQLDYQDQMAKLGIQPGVSTSVASAQQAELARQGNIELSRLGIESSALSRAQQVALQTIQSLQASRGQKLESAKFLYDANRNNLQTTLQLYQATAPQNIGTQVNERTGDVYALTKNPISGEVSMIKAGNIGAGNKAQLDFGVIGEYTDQYGTTQKQYGFIDKNTGKISSLSGGTQGSNLQVGNNNWTISNLLGNWVSGDANKEPGYASYVYNQLGVSKDTPLSDLVNRIPDVANAIANAEGWGKNGNVGTKINNPGNILWADWGKSYGATPYKSSNGYSYMQFPTQEAGFQAMHDLLAKKFGATKTDATNIPLFGLNKKLYDEGAKIADDFRQEQIVKDYNVVLGKYQSMQDIISKGIGGPGDLALVYDVMKSLDPTSVVRETEYASASKSGNLFLGAMARFNGYLTEQGGFLPDEVRQAFLSIAETKFRIATNLYTNAFNEYARRIDGAIGKNGLGEKFLTQYQNASIDPLDKHLKDLQQNSPESNFIDNLNNSLNYTPSNSNQINYTPTNVPDYSKNPFNNLS